MDKRHSKKHRKYDDVETMDLRTEYDSPYTHAKPPISEWLEWGMTLLKTEQKPSVQKVEASL